MTSTVPKHLRPAAALWRALDLPITFLQRNLTLSERPDPSVNSSFKLGTAAQTAIGLSALSAAYFQSLAGGPLSKSQGVIVDARHAVLDFHSEAWYQFLDEEDLPTLSWDDIAGVYKTKEQNGFVRLHTNFPHHRLRILEILGIDPKAANKASVQTALLHLDSKDLEAEAAKRGACAFAFRSEAEWDQKSQGIAVKQEQPVTIIKIEEATQPRPIQSGAVQGGLPLTGLRVLEMTRVLAGPVAGRTLAAQGANTLWITSPNLPSIPELDMDTSRGKRTAQLVLEQPQDIEKLKNLLRETDVFLQTYRPGSLAHRGFSPKEVAKLRPGIVYASLNAWGWTGPWKDLRGFDSLVQTATGFNDIEGRAYSEFLGKDKSDDIVPRPLPMQALDHAAGYFLAFGINAALAKTITEGGSYEVRVSLAAVGQWIKSLGRLTPEEAFGPGALPLPPRTNPPGPEIAELSGPWKGYPDGRERQMRAIRHAAQFSDVPEQPSYFAPFGLDGNNAEWWS